MRQSLKASWHDLPEAAEPAPSATVLPFETTRRSPTGDHRPEVTEVLAALAGAADEIRAADARVAQADTTARELSGRLAAAEERAFAAESQAAGLAERLQAAEVSLRLSERKFLQLTEWHAHQQAEAEAEIERYRALAADEEERRAAFQRSSADQDDAIRQIVDEAGNRIYAAEARAAEAARDFEALRDYIRSNFSR